MSSSVGTHEENLEKLRSNARRGKWSEVLDIYKQETALRTAKITATEDTVLHMAVSNGEEEVVANMVNMLVLEENNISQHNVVVTVDGDSNESRNLNIVLGAENDRKNTPLHLAASMGNIEMCEKIGGADPSLLARRNIAGETPLFLAALYGKKEAFLWLHYNYSGSPGVSSTDFTHCIRDNGDTILHCAIAHEYFDVAIEIVYLYKDLVSGMRRNKDGLSPLHILAAKRSAFKSTALLERSSLAHSVYRNLEVEEKNQATTFEELQQSLRVPMEAKFELILKKNEENIFLIKFVKFMLLLRFLLISLLKPFSEVGRWFHGIQKMKKKHTWSLQIMSQLLQHVSDEDMSKIIERNAFKEPSISLQTEEHNESESKASPAQVTITIETPLMVAVKNGVMEMVEKILELFPSRIKDMNAEGKNIILLAVEYRQSSVYRFLCKQRWLIESLFRQVDKEGNNALHWAARLGVEPDWLNPGEVLSTLREMKWFEFVKNSVPHDLLEKCNRKMETPSDIFKESHKELMKSEGEWVAKTSQACSVVSILVASVAFATRITVPGGYDDNGYAILRNETPVFKYFSNSSFGALFCSLFSTISFLSIVASPSQSIHSWRYIPFKLYTGMYFMFLSIVFLWISFCAGHFFMVDDDNRKLHKALPNYILTSLAIFLFVVAQLPTFFGPVLSIPVPKRKAIHPIEYRRTKNQKNGSDLNSQN